LRLVSPWVQGDHVSEGESFGEHRPDRDTDALFEDVPLPQGDHQVDRGGVDPLVFVSAMAVCLPD